MMNTGLSPNCYSEWDPYGYGGFEPCSEDNIGLTFTIFGDDLPNLFIGADQ